MGLVLMLLAFAILVFSVAFLANRRSPRKNPVIPILPMAPHTPYRSGLSGTERLQNIAEAVVRNSKTPLPRKAIRHRIRRWGFKDPFTPEQIQAILITLETNHHTIKRLRRRGRPTTLYVPTSNRRLLYKAA